MADKAWFSGGTAVSELDCDFGAELTVNVASRSTPDLAADVSVAATQRYVVDGVEEARGDWEAAVGTALTANDEVTLVVVAVPLANEWRVDIAD